jgi:sporulation protein YlmC with PRC-barrel domain
MLRLCARISRKEAQMNRSIFRHCLVAVPLLVLAGGNIARAQQPGQQQPGQQQQQPGQQQVPIAGAQPIGMTVEETAIVAKGWSGKKDLLGKAVYNDKGEKIGSVSDVIIAPDKSASFAVVSTGGFVGLAKHDVAVPFSQLQMSGNRVTLPGATKDALKSLPEFVYAK